MMATPSPKFGGSVRHATRLTAVTDHEQRFVSGNGSGLGTVGAGFPGRGDDSSRSVGLMPKHSGVNVGR